MAFRGVLALVPTCLLLTSCAASRPNILFVLTDDMGWGDVSYNTEYYQPGAGGQNWTVNHPRTPNIDALALGEHTMLFRRWYTGSAVCSPTRASILTGRTPQRSCIDSAEGCGQSPAWNCYDKMPLPPTEFTVAEAAKVRNYSTLFVGKWHLGDFWDKGEPSKGNYALSKWPSSHPAMHGFDEWHATEASASSSTPNCGCNPAWKNEGSGCIVGGGNWVKDSLECTNYWRAASLPVTEPCSQSKTSARQCVANLTEKIQGDDSQYMMSKFEDFVVRHKRTPWLAQLSIHTNHEPHPALPEWYNNYTEAEGGPAGDYLGTISQMDAAIGRMVELLKTHGAFENTMLWFSAGDNGAHTAGRPSGQNSASNGLRQCKASLFEGGIRVGGFITWPQMISSHVETYHSAVSNDFLPTVMDLLDVKHPHPEWHHDGMSLLPLITGEIPPTSHRTQPIGFAQSGQVAWLNDTGTDGVWKLVYKPQKGQCEKFLEPYGSMKDKTGPFLFNLTEDPTESNDLCKQDTTRCNHMKSAMEAFTDSIEYSRVHESKCAKETPTPTPTPPIKGGFQLELIAGAGTPGECLAVQALDKHAIVIIGSCNNSKSQWGLERDALVSLADSELCLKLDDMDRHPQGCVEGNTIWMGKCQSRNTFGLGATGQLVSKECPGMCAIPASHAPVFVYSSAAVALGDCQSRSSFRFKNVTYE